MDINVLRKLNSPVFYVTNDVARGIGLENILPNYHIICLDDNPLVDILQKEGVSVFCLERFLQKKNLLFRNSGIILAHPAVISFINEKSRGLTPNIIFFKPQRKIEIIAQKNGYNLIGNSSCLNRKFEDKINFFRLCRKAVIAVPPGETIELAKVEFKDLVLKYGTSFVLQFGRGWAGNSTFFIETDEKLRDIKEKFGNIRAKVSKYIKGKTVLNNNVIFNDQLLQSKPALQITADRILTSNEGGTGGRQWPARLKKEQEEEIEEITKQVALLMKHEGYKGFFGLDFIVEDKTGKVYLSENNARLTASSPFYTKLEIEADFFPLLGYHLLSFLPEISFLDQNYSCPDVFGGEIIARNTSGKKVIVNGSMKTGIYNRNLEFKYESSFLDSRESGDFWLDTVSLGRIVNPEIEIARINSFSPVCEESGELKTQYKILLERIIAELKLL